MKDRIVGVDIARFVALVGMMAIHVLPAFVAGEVTFSQSLAGGRASALFAVLAGVSISLANRGRAVAPREWDRAAAELVTRATLIASLGFLLGSLDTRIAVILVYYGLLFAIGAPFLLVHTRTLLYGAAVWVFLGPVLSQLVRPTLPGPSGQSPSFESLAEPGSLLSELVFTGFYPVFVWLAYLLVGLAVGRLDLRSWRTAGLLSAVGAALVGTAYVVSDSLLARDGVREQLAGRDLSGSLSGTTPTNTWWWLVVRSAHSGTPLDLIQTIGSALLVLGVCLFVGRLLPRLSSVLFGAGAMTLTLYTLHVLLRQRGVWDAETEPVYVGQVLLVAAIGALFGVLRLRGPLELLVSRVSKNVAGR